MSREEYNNRTSRQVKQMDGKLVPLGRMLRLNVGTSAKISSRSERKKKVRRRMGPT